VVQWQRRRGILWVNLVVSEQGDTLAYAVTEWGETGKCKAYAVPRMVWGVRLGSRMTYAAPRVLLSKSRIDTRTQTEGPSPYWYRLYTKESQANTTSSRARTATNTESTCSSATDTSSTCSSDRTS
jgi:hypothetical protein